MLGLRCSSSSGGTSGGVDYYSSCQPASTLHATTTIKQATATPDTTRAAPLVTAKTTKIKATEETSSSNFKSNNKTPGTLTTELDGSSNSSSNNKRPQQQRSTKNLLRLQRDYVILVIALIFVTLNQNSDNFTRDICLCQRRASQHQLEQFLLKVFKRNSGGTHKSTTAGASTVTQKSNQFTKIPRKSVTTNPSTSRNYYLSRGSTGSSSGAITAGSGQPSGSSGNTGIGNNYYPPPPAPTVNNNNENSNNSTTAAMMMTKQKATMADRLNIGSEVKELKLGCTFNSKNTTTAFHTIKYDFKPASVDVNRVADVDIGSNNQVTVTVPNLESSGVPHTVYKGNHKKYTKECLIIYDKKTGDMTLEKLNHNIQVKKTRSEMTNKSVGPAQKLENSTMRVSSKTKVSTGSRKNHIIGYVPRNSPMQQGSSPSTAPVHKSPQSAPVWNANNAQATLPSIPMITDDDDAGPMFQGAGSGGSSGAGSASSIANLSSSSSASSHNNSGDFHVPQQQQQKQSKSQPHYNQQPPPHQQQQPKHHSQRHQQQQQQSQQQQQQQQWHQQLQHQQQMQQPSPSQQQYHNQNNRMYHNSSSNNSNVIGMGGIGSNSSSNNCRPSSSSNSIGTDQTASQMLASSAAALEQEIGVLSSSDTSTDTDSSGSDSGSDSDESNEDYSQNSQQPIHQQQSLQHQLPNLQATVPPQQQQSQQQSTGYANGNYPNVLHIDLQLSESNSSDSSDDGDD